MDFLANLTIIRRIFWLPLQKITWFFEPKYSILLGALKIRISLTFFYSIIRGMEFGYFEFFSMILTKFLSNNDLQLFLHVVRNYPLWQNCARTELPFETTNIVQKLIRFANNFDFFLSRVTGNIIYSLSLPRNCPVVFLNAPLKLSQKWEKITTFKTTSSHLTIHVMADNVRGLSQPDCSVCISILVEFNYKESTTNLAGIYRDCKRMSSFSRQTPSVPKPQTFLWHLVLPRF